MNVVAAIVVGYVVGAKTGGKELDRLGRSLRALCGTDEFAEVVAATRAQVGSTLRELAAIVDGGPGQADPEGDVLSRVRHLVDRD